MKVKLIAGAALLAGSLLGSTALSSAADVPAGTQLAADQTFNYRVLDKINSLDPQIVEDVDTSYVVSNIFEGLYNEDSTGKVVPGVATSYDVSDDKLTYTFHLRPEAKWSNGDPVTAGDFVFGWERAVDPKTASPYAYFLPLASVVNAQDIIDGKKKPTELGVKAVDDHTFQVTLSGPTPYFALMGTHPTLFPVPQKVVEKFGDDWTKPENIVGNGAFTLKTNSPGERVVLERNKAYWDDSKTALQTLNFITVNDDEQGITRYKAGELDQTDIPVGQFPTLQGSMPDDAHSIPWVCNYYYVMNLGPNGPDFFKNEDVRRALAYALDRDVMVNSVLQNGQVTAYTFTPPYMANFKSEEPDWQKLSQDDRDAQAKELMAKAGFGPDNPLKFTIISNSNSRHDALATVATQMWKEKLGVEATYQTQEFATLLSDRHAGNFQMARDAWCADYNEASTFLTLMLSTSEQNDAKWANADYDKLMESSKTAADPNAVYAQAEKMIGDNMVVIPVFFDSKAVLQKAYVGGFPFKNPELLWYGKDIYIKAH